MEEADKILLTQAACNEIKNTYLLIRIDNLKVLLWITVPLTLFILVLLGYEGYRAAFAAGTKAAEEWAGRSAAKQTIDGLITTTKANSDLIAQRLVIAQTDADAITKLRSQVGADLPVQIKSMQDRLKVIEDWQPTANMVIAWVNHLQEFVDVNSGEHLLGIKYGNGSKLVQFEAGGEIAGYDSTIKPPKHLGNIKIGK